MHILRERPAQRIRHHRLVLPDQFLPIFSLQLDIGKEALVFLGDFQRVFEQVMIDAEHDVGVHLDKATIAVPGESRIARGGGQALDRLIVKAEIEHRVHHPRHRYPCARTYRDQQRVGSIAKILAHGLFDMGQRGGDIGPQRIREIGAFAQIADTFLRSDREARRHRQADPSHFREVCTLAAADNLVPRARIFMANTAAERIDLVYHSFTSHGSVGISATEP